MKLHNKQQLHGNPLRVVLPVTCRCLLALDLFILAVVCITRPTIDKYSRIRRHGGSCTLLIEATDGTRVCCDDVGSFQEGAFAGLCRNLTPGVTGDPHLSSLKTSILLTLFPILVVLVTDMRFERRVLVRGLVYCVVMVIRAQILYKFGNFVESLIIPEGSLYDFSDHTVFFLVQILPPAAVELYLSQKKERRNNVQLMFLAAYAFWIHLAVWESFWRTCGVYHTTSECQVGGIIGGFGSFLVTKTLIIL